jgi:hypothetical protein
MYGKVELLVALHFPETFMALLLVVSNEIYPIKGTQW